MRLVFLTFVLLPLFCSCTMIEKKEFKFSSVKMQGDWGSTTAYLEHVVLAEDLDKMKFGTFFLSLSGTKIGSDMQEIKIVSARLLRADTGEVAYEFEPGSGESDSLDPESPFYFGRIKLEYVDYKLSVNIDVYRGRKADRQQMSGVFVTRFSSHKTFSYWEALKGV